MNSLGATLMLRLFRMLVWIAFMPVASPWVAGASGPTPMHVVILTQQSLTRFELQTGRRLASVDVSPDTTRKVVHAAPFVFVQRKRAVYVLGEETLQRRSALEFQDEVKDIAAGGDLLVVARGPMDTPGTSRAKEGSIHIIRVGSDGSTRTVRALQVPKPVHGLLMQGLSLYAIDDVVTPVYAHYVDLQRPEQARVSTITWAGVYAHFVSQAVADRWYIFGTHWSGPMNTGMTEAFLTLPLRPPLQFLNKVEQRYPGHFHNAPAEFQVHGGFVFWAAGGSSERTWLKRRSMGGTTVAELLPIGPLILQPIARKGVVDLVGVRLYVAAHKELIGFDLNGAKRPSRAQGISTPAAIVSFGLEKQR